MTAPQEIMISWGLLLQVNCRIHTINVFLIQFLPKKLHGFSKSLEMNNLTLPEEFYHIVDIRVIRQPKDIIIGHSGFLLCCNRINTTISKTENSSNRERLLCRKPLCCPSVSMRLFVYNKAKNIIERFLFL